MSDIEDRLAALEKRAAEDTERWPAVAGDIMGVVLTIDAIGAAICADNEQLLRNIILNLNNCENSARMQNEHHLTIGRIRYAREFFESRLEKVEKGSRRRGRSS
jgi:hypothetical protein